MDKNYNFQVHDGKSWETSEAKTIEFETREKAIDFAYNLSNFTGKEVRLSQGDYKRANGTYIKY